MRLNPVFNSRLSLTNRKSESFYSKSKRTFHFRPQWSVPIRQHPDFFSLNPRPDEDEDVYGNISLRSWEMKNLVKSRSHSNLSRAKSLCPNCTMGKQDKFEVDSVRDEHIKRIIGEIPESNKKHGKHIKSSLSFSGCSTRVKTSPMKFVKTVAEISNNIRVSQVAKRQNSKGEIFYASRYHSKPNTEHQMEILPRSSTPNLGGKKAKPRVSEDILKRLDELKKSANFDGACEMFDQAPRNSAATEITVTKF